MSEQPGSEWAEDTARRPVPADLERMVRNELSLPARMRYVAVGLAGLAGAALIGLLWTTEPGPLPVATQAAFGVLIAIGLAWAGFAGWTVSRRRPLYARDQFLAARLALAAAIVTAVGGVLLAAVRGSAEVVVGTGLAGLALIGAALLLVHRARNRQRDLLRLRDELRQDGSG